MALIDPFDSPGYSPTSQTQDQETASGLIDPFDDATSSPYAETAQHQERQQPQEEKGFLQRIGALVTGNDRTEFEELGEFEAKGAEAGEQARIAAGLLSAVDEKAQEDIIRKQLPGAKIEYDRYGNAIVEYKGERGYLNKPGLSTRDATQFTAQALSYIPAAKAATLGKTLAQRIGIVGAGSAATSVGLDVAAEALGSEQGVSGERAVVAGVAGGLFEGVSPIVIKGLRKIFGTPSYVTNGKLNEAGIDAARKMGIDPSSLSDEMMGAFARSAKEAVPEEQATSQILKERFDVPLTKGQASGDFRQLAREEAMRADALGGRAGRIMREFDELQQAKIKSAAENVQGELSGGQRLVSTENQAGGIIGQGIRQKSQAAEAAIGEAYEAARDARAYFSMDAIDDLVLSAKRSLSGRLVDQGSDSLTPSTVKALKEIESLSNRRPVEGAKLTALSLNRVETARRKLNQFYDAAKNKTDKANIQIIKRSLDEWVDKTVDTALFSGDDQAIETLKNARMLRAEYGKKFQPRGKDDIVGKELEKIINNDPTPEQTVDYLLGRGRLGAKRASAETAKRLKDIFGRDSEEFNALREAAFLRMTEPARRGGEFSATQYIKAVDDAINGGGESVMKELFTPAEINDFKAFARQLEKTITPRLAKNPSGTSAAVSRLVQDYMGRLAAALGFSGDLVTGGAVGVASKTPGALSGIRARQAVRGVSVPLRARPELIGAATAGATTSQD